MNPKTPSTVLTAETKPARVPKLRFPEFRGTEGWKEKRLGNEGDFLSSLTGKAGGDFDIGEARFVTYMNVFSNTFVDPKGLRLVDVKEGENQNAVASGDVFFTVSSETPEEVGMSSVLLEDLENCYLNSFCALFRFSKSKCPNPIFTGYLLRQPLIRDYFTKKAQGSTRFNLSKDAFRNLPFFVPKPAEQQKIAECLSSVDLAVAAQARKVDALKTHKKGLMQQLFPTEGETQPRLRFPEFQNAGEWVVKLLGEIFPITSSKRVHESDWTATGVPFYRAREIVALNKHEPIQPLSISEELYAAHSKQTGEIRDGHLLVTGVGSIGVPYLVRAGNRFYFKDGNIIWLKNDGKELSGEFLLRLYETDYVQKQLKAMADVGTVATYTIDNAKRTLAAFPRAKAEQQRIASCLSSLDTLITSETQKLEALKTHKKGLMQQLFPVLNEVQG